jgi:hypothetical protein
MPTRRESPMRGGQANELEPIASVDLPPRPPLNDVERLASDDLNRLVDRLEATLDAPQRRLLHQIRLAAESLGAVRAVVTLRGDDEPGAPSVGGPGSW